MNKTLSVLFLILSLVGFAAVGYAQPPQSSLALEPVTLQLKWQHQFQFAGFYAAKAQGYFQQEGLDVHFIERSPEQDVVEQVLSKQADFGIGDSGIITYFAKGKPIVALAAIFQHNPLVFFSRADSGIASPNELKGKRIMFDRLGENNAPLLALLHEYGISNSDYQSIKQSYSEVDDLLNGKTDLINGYLTDKPFEFRQRGIKFNIVNPKHYGFDFYGDILFTSQQELLNHPGRAERFRRASLKGWQYALAHPEDIVQLIHHQYRSPLSVEHLRYEAEAMRHLVQPEGVPLGQIEAERLWRVAQLYAEQKLSPMLDEAELKRFVYASNASQLDLTADEQTWLNQHRVIRVGVDRDFAPYEWVNAKGDYLGLTADYLHLIEAKLGVRFELVADKPWSEILEMAKKGELDMLANASRTPERDAFLAFSTPYLQHPIVIITVNKDYLGDLNQLAGRLVAIEKGYFMEELLRKNHPDIQLLMVGSTKEALKQVAMGKADAYIGHAASASYLMKKEGMLQLTFAGDTGYYGTHSFASVKSAPQLQGILEKVLASISEVEKNKIQNTWLNLKIEQGISYETVSKISLTASLLALLTGYWIYRLRKEIKARHLAEIMSKQSEAKLLAILEAEPECVTIVDSSGRLLYMNAAGLNMLGAGEAENGVLGQSMLKFVGNDDVERFIAMHQKVFLDNKPCTFEFQMKSLHGDKCYDAETHVVRFNDGLAHKNCLLAVTRDISERKRADTNLRLSEERFRSLFEHSPVAYQSLDINGQFVDVNERMCELLGYEREELLCKNFADIWCDDNKPFAPTFEQFKQRNWVDCELQLKCKDNTVVTVMLNGRIQRDNQDRFIKTHCVLTDISARKQAEEKLILAAQVFSSAHEGISITDVNGVIIDVNPAFCLVTGYSRDELIGKQHNLLKSGRHSPRFYQEMWQALKTDGYWKGEIWNVNKTGEPSAQLLTISALRDTQGEIINYIGLFSDITQTKQQQQELELLAHFDPLTSLPNRVLFADRFSQAMAHTKRSNTLLAVCYLDLDGFKQVNDRFGHEVGDQLLIEVAKRIRGNLREEDTISRLGGDEFALLLRDVVSVSQCEFMMERIHRRLAEPFILSEQHLRIAASSGITLYPLDNEQADILLRHADQAMYQAKQAGRNCYRFYDLRQDQYYQSHHQRLNELKQAFKTQQFCLYYQPKVNMKTGQVFGMESLIRWQHPERGILPPGEFLATLQSSSLEVEINYWVIQEALAQLDRWNQQGLHLQLSVNVSPCLLQSKDFVKQLDVLLALFPKVDSRQLELEVLESSVLDDVLMVENVLKECYQSLGITFALDDFGTGYSSLIHLRHLTVDTVKIDQSFVRDLLDDPDDQAIVDGVIALSTAFGRHVIAEGVETLHHGLALLTMGCYLAQGHGIAQPMPADEVFDWVCGYQSPQEWQTLAQTAYTTRQAQLKFLCIQLNFAKDRISQYLQYGYQNNQTWPIPSVKKCALGRWLAAVKQDPSLAVSAETLADLEQQHGKWHSLSGELRHVCQQNRIDDAQQRLPDVLIVHAKLIALLEAV